MAKKKIKNVLLVEGKDDLHTVANLLQYHLNINNVKLLVSIYETEGWENLSSSLNIYFNRNFDKIKFHFETVLKDSMFDNLGIIVDANNDISARWQSLQNTLRNAQTDMPKKPNPNGTIFKVTIPDGRIINMGIWLMPNNQDTGMLEDFLLGLMPLNNDNILKHIECCLDELSDSDLKILEIDSKDNPETWRLKAKLHTWLAWQKEPGDPYGTAIGKYFKPSLEITQNFMAWLSDLFELDTRL